MRDLRLASLSAVFAVALSVMPAQAETVNCTHITTLPAVITIPGVYCLTQSLTTAIASGNAIDVQASNVVIDLNGFRVAGLAAGLGTGAVGIHALNRQNITIKNGIVRGFFAGIQLEGGGTGHLIEDVLADQNTAYGIMIQAARSVIRRNRVLTTGGTTKETGVGTAVVGILVVTGAGVRVIDNDVAAVTRGATEISAGIAFDGGLNNFVVDNRISAVTDAGILFDSGGTGKYRGNLTSGIPTPYSGGTDAGDNN